MMQFLQELRGTERLCPLNPRCHSRQMKRFVTRRAVTEHDYF
jgi:hypothetical protein